MKQKINLNILTAIEIYKMVINKEIGKFPNGFWQRPEAPQNAISCTKYMIEEILKWNEDDVKKQLIQKTFINNKLSGMLQLVYNSSPYEAIEAAYPKKYKQWELFQTGKDFWNKQTAIQVTKWLFEEKLKWNKDKMDNDQIHNNIIEIVTKEFFESNGLTSALAQYNNSPYQLLNATYPNEFKPWELITTPNGYWNKQTATEAFEWALKKAGWKIKDIKENIDRTFFKKYRITGVLDVFDNLYDVVNNSYPNEIKPWDLKATPQGYWNKTTGIMATKWLIDEKLKWTDQQVIENLTYDTFLDNGLISVVANIFNNSLYDTINAAYPNKYQSWQFPRVQRNYWTDDNKIKIMKWLFEEKLKWNKNDIKEKFNFQILIDNELTKIYYSSNGLYDLVNLTYPNEFNPHNFKNTKHE